MYNENQFNYREFAKDRLSNRHIFVNLETDKIPVEKGQNECYCSYYLYSGDILNYFNRKSSLKGYEDAVYTNELVVDIDSDDLEAALESLRKLLDIQKENYELDLNLVKVNFSGSKGFHLRMPAMLFGGFTPSANLPKVIKQLAQALCSDVLKIDESIYTHTHLIRIPNTINGKSGLVAIPLSVDEVFRLSIDEIKLMAVSPRDVTYCDEDEIEPCEALVELLEKVLKSSLKSPEKKPLGEIPGEKHATGKLWMSASEGNRHMAMGRIIGHLIKHGVPDHSIIEMVKLWNLQNDPPKDSSLLIKEAQHYLDTYSNINGDYWKITRDNNGETEVELDMLDYINFLEVEGFSKVYLDKGYVFIKTENNILAETSLPKIKDHVLNNIRTKETLPDCYKSELLNRLISKSGYYVGEKLIECVTPIDLKIKRDNKHSATFYYQNAVVEVSKDSGIKVTDYDNLNGLIWQSQILKRDFVLNTTEKSVFEKFLFNVAKQSDERLNTIKSSIGYLLHGFKDSSNAKVIVLVDEKIPENQEPNGRTGKSLFGKAISQMKNSVRLDGKNFSFDKSFAFQQVKLDTEIMEFNDVRRDFDFERLFSVATDAMTVEKKNKDEFTIPFDRSPKIVVSTNYTLKGTGDSFKARLFEIEFSDYYNASHQPKDDFHKMFFDEWDQKEWMRFDNFMLSCVEYYLNSGLNTYTTINLDRRKLIDNTSKEFVEFVENDGVLLNREYNKSDLHFNFTRHYPDFSQLKQRSFTEWLKRYAIYKGLKYFDRKSDGKSLVILSDSMGIMEYEDKESSGGSYLFD